MGSSHSPKYSVPGSGADVLSMYSVEGGLCRCLQTRPYSEIRCFVQLQLAQESPVLPKTGNYQSEWLKFRIRRKSLAMLIFAEFIAPPFFLALAVAVERRLFSTARPTFAAWLLWGGMMLFTVSRLRNFTCPRCGENYFGGLLATRNISGRRCANCDLPRYAGE